MALSQKQLKIIAYIILSIAILLILLVIFIPIIIKKGIESDYQEKTIPSQNNINIWAKFPGDINSKTTHTFKFFDYSDNSLIIKDSISLIENTSYDNFIFDDGNNKINFEVKSEFKMEKIQLKEDKIKTINMGMFETLETLTNVPKYQVGINSIIYLFNKVFDSPELFIKKLYCYDLFTNLIYDEDKVKKIILNEIEQYKVDRILSEKTLYEKYSFKKIEGFYNWVKLINNKEKIEKANWLYDLFNLTETDIAHILGKDSYLNNYYIDLNKNLAKKFECLNESFCGNEIFYRQLLTGEVISYFGLNNISELYHYIDPELYPFDKSPELFLYFEEYKKNINNPEIKYEDYIPNKITFRNILDKSSSVSILSSKISSLFLMINNTNDIDKAKSIYNNITFNNLKLISNYIYDYLPKLFIYQDFLDEDSGSYHAIDQYSHAFVTITQSIMYKTYGLLRKTKNIYNLILSNLVWSALIENILREKTKISNKIYKYEPDEICPLIMQKALNDGKKVLTICSDPNTSFNSPETLLKWLSPYYCVMNIIDKSKCDMSVINYLKELVYVTDEEIQLIYDQHYLGGIFDYIDKKLKSAYECENEQECNDEYLSKLQFWKSGLTKNLPFNSSNSISDLFPDLFPYPFELYYFALKYNYTDEIMEDDIDSLINLYSDDNNILDEENKEAFNTKINLEKLYSMELERKEEEEEGNNTIFKIMDLLNKGYLFGNEIKEKYNIYNILQGNNLEDNKYIEFLSNGNIFEGYKPNLNQTTGFNFGFNLSYGNTINKKFDQYQINNNEDNLRKILKINDFQILNIQKLEYDYLSNEYSYITAPIYNYQSLSNQNKYSDGFQYDTSENDIYFYDSISSRPFKFSYKESVDYNDINCKKYELNKNDISININEENDINYKKAFLTKKLNKPFIVSIGKDNIDMNINENIEEENFICVDPFTNMVIQSKINLMYSIYSKNYGYINPDIVNNKAYPIFLYQKIFEVDTNSYLVYFPDIDYYNNFKTIFIIVGIALILICVAVTLIIFIKIHKNLVNEDIVMNSGVRENIINDSREQTIMAKSDL